MDPAPPPQRTTTIRRSLVVSLMLLVGLTGGGVLVVSWISAERTVDDLAKLLIEPTAKRVAAELDRFFGDVRSHVLVGKAWAESGSLDATDSDSLNELFVPILEEYPQVSSMMVADSNGVEYLLLRDALDPNVWVNRVVRADEWGTRVFHRRWNSATGEIEESFGQLDYDPRRRVWYREAMLTDSSNPVFWTEPVIFFITKDPGITASTHLHNEDSSAPDEPETVVVAFDLLLLDISRFTSQLEVSKNGRAFVLVEREGVDGMSVVGLPYDERYQTDEALRDALIFVPPDSATPDADARLPSIPDLGAPALEDAVQAWNEQGRSERPIEYRSDGRDWLVGFQPYEVGRNTFWIVVALPQRDLLGNVRSQRAALLIVVALILVFGVSRAFVLARRFGAPVEALVEETERISAGDLESQATIRSKVREYLRLAEAQDSMREALKDRMRLEKIERDLDIARDIQRSLLPESTPILEGYEIAGWSLPADQTGGDFYDWFALPDGRLVFTLADVTGHGIGPALIVGGYRAYLRASATSDTGHLSDAMTQINALLYEDMPEERFITAVIGQLDAGRNKLSMLSAGHGPLLFYHAQTGELSQWSADEPPLGVINDIPFGPAREIDLQPGDTLILVTDGFFEWANPQGELFGLERLNTFVREHQHLAAEKLIDALQAEVRRHAAGAEQDDDLTALIIRRRQE